MSLEKLLFVDTQTTGMRPPQAQLIEIAWAELEAKKAQSFLVELSEGRTLSPRVREITGLDDLTGAKSIDEVRAQFHGALSGISALVIHYAQFEKPFLIDLLQSELQLPVICTYQLAKRLFPTLPSRNIRATAGFFGPPVLGPNRASVFVQATEQIWRGLTAELEKRDLKDFAGIQEFLSQKPPKAPRYEYRVDKLKRLHLPASPGVYRMLSQTGAVLYVGKATSLKDRVNSYFRGKKGRDARKLEMLAQVWDFEVTACESPLEAALLEADEIKRLNPPYNVVFKTGKRQLLFYDREFESASLTQDETHRLGPFRPNSQIEALRALKAENWSKVFFEPLPDEDVKAGFGMFRQAQGLQEKISLRQLLAHGLKLYRAYEEPEETEEDLPEDEDKEEVITVEDIAEKFERLFRHAGFEYRRAYRLTPLLEARVQLGERCLQFHAGQLNGPNHARSTPWAGLGIDTYDRMSILRSELDRSQQCANSE
jgi:DNA polymerase-3 subunit epsilon